MERTAKHKVKEKRTKTSIRNTAKLQRKKTRKTAITNKNIRYMRDVIACESMSAIRCQGHSGFLDKTASQAKSVPAAYDKHELLQASKDCLIGPKLLLQRSLKLVKLNVPRTSHRCTLVNIKPKPFCATPA